MFDLLLLLSSQQHVGHWHETPTRDLLAPVLQAIDAHTELQLTASSQAHLHRTLCKPNGLYSSQPPSS